MTVRVRDIDKGGKALRAALADLERSPTVTVGVHEDIGAAMHRGSTQASVADVAAAQEFAPGRSWLRATIDEQRSAIERALAASARETLGGAGRGQARRALGRVAARFAAALRARVRRLGLVQTGHLLESIEGRVDGRPASEEVE